MAEQHPGPAQAEAPGWELTARTYPTNLAPGERGGTIAIDVFNVGAVAAGCTADLRAEEEGTTSNPTCPESSPKVQASPFTVTDLLPPGVTAREAGELQGVVDGLHPRIAHLRWDCGGNTPSGGVAGATVVTCTNDPAGLPILLGGGGAPTDNESHPNLMPPIGISVNAGPPASGLVNHASIAGGGAPTTASTMDPVKVSTEAPAFGFASADAWLSNADGTLDTLAGSHPYEATFAFDLTTVVGSGELQPAGGEPRHLEVQLPPGLIADPTAVPQCTRPQLAAERCPQASIVGLDAPYFASGIAKATAVFNMAPPPGVPVQFGASIGGILVYIDAGVRTGADYSATAHAQLPQRVFVKNVLTLWGVPGEASHNPWRDGEFGGCSRAEIEAAGTPEETFTQYCVAPHFPALKPLLTVPTICGASTPLTMRADDWQSSAMTEATFTLQNSNGAPSTFVGCEDLNFGPLITTAAQTAETDAPTGLSTELKPALGGLQERGLRSTSDIKHATVTLPEGFVVNPGRAAGLQACQENTTESAIGTEGPAQCPAAAKLGTAKIRTPLLEAAEEKELEGAVYLLQSNPPTLHLLVAASADGVNFKLVGIAHLNESTGRVEASFGENTSVEAEDPFLRGHMGLPPLPFSSFKLVFEGGAHASLDTPTQCGTYTTDANFVPWASPFIPDLNTSAALAITSGPSGTPCPSGPLPFSPTMTAGSTNTQAGAFTGFSLLLKRADGQQRIEKFQFTEPAGLAGLISQIPLCPEPQATQGTCDEASKIGHTIVTSGPGNNPLTLPQPGGPELPIYLTGPYHGAPFGLSIKTPIVAGPFNLGTIVTRAKIDVNPTTAQITITTDPLPQIVKGVPTDIRAINSVIDRPEFLFNPTNCSEQAFTGTATSAQGATAPISSHFGIGGCRELPFKPTFTATTTGKTSKANGASLTVKVTAKPGEANIHKVNLQLPLALPSRLSTLQKACTEAQFNTNPAGCPEGSFIGSATAHTPVLNAPLTGPAILVSHGGAGFPDVEFLLQGEDVHITLDGKTDIKKGITYSSFETVPDAPITTFETVLPTGPHSILGTNLPTKANFSLCANTKLVSVKKKVKVHVHGHTRHVIRTGKKTIPIPLSMPTKITGQNGAVITQTTPIAVTGCPKARAGKAAKRAHAKRRRRKR